MDTTNLIAELNGLSERRTIVSTFERAPRSAAGLPLRFRHWNVESLLNDAASLLERGLTQRTYPLFTSCA